MLVIGRQQINVFLAFPVGTPIFGADRSDVALVYTIKKC
jgi:hypothetical protein